MTKQQSKNHPADAVDPAAVATATEFTATLFRGVGKFDRAAARTLAAIRAKARELETAAGPNARRAIIHAVVNGRAIPVPAKFDGAAVPAKKAPAKKVAPKKDGPSKTDTVIKMLRKGATRAAIVEATGWKVDLKQLAARKGLKLKKDADGVITATGGK